MEKYKSFIPTHLFDTVSKEWVKINEEKKDFLSKEFMGNYFLESITELSTGTIYVTWDYTEKPSLYKGKLEYTDEYQLILDAELKELSKDFKFKL